MLVRTSRPEILAMHRSILSLAVLTGLGLAPLARADEPGLRPTLIATPTGRTAAATSPGGGTVAPPVPPSKPPSQNHRPHGH